MRVKEGIISLLKTQPNLTARQIVATTGFSHDSVKVTLCKLINEKKVVRFKGVKPPVLESQGWGSKNTGPKDVFYYNVPAEPTA
jgi:hypothetical protein